MFLRKGISTVRVDLTNILADVQENDTIVVILDRGKGVGALVPIRLATAIENCAAMQSPETEPVEYAITVLDLDSTTEQMGVERAANSSRR